MEEDQSGGNGRSPGKRCCWLPWMGGQSKWIDPSVSKCMNLGLSKWIDPSVSKWMDPGVSQWMDPGVCNGMGLMESLLQGESRRREPWPGCVRQED